MKELCRVLIAYTIFLMTLIAFSLAVFGSKITLLTFGIIHLGSFLMIIALSRGKENLPSGITKTKNLRLSVHRGWPH